VAAFGLRDYDITPLSYVGNAIFAVDCQRGPHVLRIPRPGHPPLNWIESEMRWLADLKAQTHLCAPQPVKTVDDSWLAMAAVEGIPTALPAVLLTWIEGESRQAEDLTSTDVEQIGAFLARLHEFSAIYTPPADFVRPRLDWEGLFGANSPYNPGDGAAIFQPEQIAVMDAVADRVRHVMRALDADAHTFGMIHGDFITKNTLFQGDHVCALDFEYCAFGYFLYDLAPVLLGLSPLPHYATLKAALWQGYTAHRRLPDHYRDYLETFVAGRHVASCRWIASNLDNPQVRERAPQILADRTDELRDYLRTGRLERKSAIL
jgi:Ser/Thr protein kinase RdoA (MazF antagonist)